MILVTIMSFMISLTLMTQNPPPIYMKIDPKKGGVGGEGGSRGSRENHHSIVVTSLLTPEKKAPPLGVLLYIGGGFLTHFWGFFDFFGHFLTFFDIFGPKTRFSGHFRGHFGSKSWFLGSKFTFWVKKLDFGSKKGQNYWPVCCDFGQKSRFFSQNHQFLRYDSWFDAVRVLNISVFSVEPIDKSI